MTRPTINHSVILQANIFQTKRVCYLSQTMQRSSQVLLRDLVGFQIRQYRGFGLTSKTRFEIATPRVRLIVKKLISISEDHFNKNKICLLKFCFITSVENFNNIWTQTNKFFIVFFNKNFLHFQCFFHMLILFINDLAHGVETQQLNFFTPDAPQWISLGPCARQLPKPFSRLQKPFARLLPSIFTVWACKVKLSTLAPQVEC